MIDQKYLHRCLHYDSETGVFTWLNRPAEQFKNARAQKAWNNRWAGKVAGAVSEANGIRYTQISIEAILYKAHRLAWLYEYGETPKQDLDHINGNGLDNRILNLREVTNEMNHRNMKLSRVNKTGVCGVHMQRGRYLAQIRHAGKTRHLGTYDTLEQAARVRLGAERKYGYHPDHGVRE